jgi:hypothetical protein
MYKQSKHKLMGGDTTSAPSLLKPRSCSLTRESYLSLCSICFARKCGKITNKILLTKCKLRPLIFHFFFLLCALIVFLPPSSLQPSYQYFDVTLYIMSYLQINVWRWTKRCSTVGTICKWALRCNFSFLQLCKWKAKNAFSNAFIHILSS